MKLATTILVLLFACLAWASGLISRTAPNPEELAQKSAESWLALADASKYAESWDNASQYFKNAVTKDKWISALQSVRSPTRQGTFPQTEGATFTKTLPGAPDGEYSVETIVPMLDKDGKWSTSGYFIQ